MNLKSLLRAFLIDMNDKYTGLKISNTLPILADNEVKQFLHSLADQRFIQSIPSFHITMDKVDGLVLHFSLEEFQKTFGFSVSETWENDAPDKVFKDLLR